MAMAYVPSALTIAKLNIGFGLINLIPSYCMPKVAVSQWFSKEGYPKDQELAEYLISFVGQHDVPWVVMSILAVSTGNVSKEYVLASAIYGAFLTLDIPLRVLRKCEKVGIGKEGVYASIPLVAMIGGLSYLRWTQM